MHPDRVVIGAESEFASYMMKEAYKVLFLNAVPLLIIDNVSAELISIRSNMLHRKSQMLWAETFLERP